MRDSVGATAVEFALILPLLIMLVVGTMEVGRLIWVQNALETAVQAGARYGSIHSDATTAEIASKARQSVSLDTAAADFSVTTSTDANGVDFIAVAVSQKATLMIPFTALIAGESVTLTATARFPMAQ